MSRDRVPRGTRRGGGERRAAATRRQGGAVGAPMRQARPGTDRWTTPRSSPTSGGRWTFKVEAWGDPSPPGGTTPGSRSPPGIDVELMLDEGALGCSSGRGQGRAEGRRPPRCSRTPPRRCATPSARSRPRVGGRLARRGRRRPRAAPAARAGDHRRALPAAASTASGRCTAPGTSSSPAPRAPSHDRPPASARRARSRTAAERLPAIAEMGFDVVYLPPIHPIGARQPQGPEQHARPRARRPRLAVGDRLGGRRARRHPPRPRHLRGLRRLRRAGPASSAWRSPSTSRCSAAPDHPWVTEHPEWFTTRADGTIAYAENPPKKYQDIYPINFDNDPEGIYAEVPAGRPALDRATASGSSASTTRTPSRWRSGSGCSPRSTRPTPTCCSWPRRSPGRR